MPPITPELPGDALLPLPVPVVDGEDLVLVLVPALELLGQAVPRLAGQAAHHT